MPHLRGPQQLLEYFGHHEREDPTFAHWHHGAVMCRWWLSLIANGATQDDTDDFLGHLKAETESSPAWLELRCQFGEWAKSQGYRDWVLRIEPAHRVTRW